ncbi:MAG: hypothetical protein COB76_05115 [Alphaproteobacteria bacterium]|nr:MAG: hypothetical protein COB76_05115 [Alphaproteobacteria bacterium]
MTKTLIGIGNAAIDGMVDVPSDSTLHDLQLTKGACVFAGNDDPRMQRVFDMFPNYIKDAGGAAANAICSYAALGGQSRFIGKTGYDDHGDFFTKSMRQYGIAFDTPPTKETQSTFLFAVVTPDKERSFLSNHGASHYISGKDVKEEWFTSGTTLIIDGYMLMSDGGPDALFTAIKYAKKHGSETIFMPCSLTVIKEKSDYIQKIVPNADAVICNEEEALGFTQTDDITDIQSHFDWGVVTLGSRGAYYFTKDTNGVIPIPSTPDIIINTNGAGDNFAGGLLYGLHNGLSIEKSVKLGQLCAIHVIGRDGARCATSLKHFLEEL